MPSDTSENSSNINIQGNNIKIKQKSSTVSGNLGYHAGDHGKAEFLNQQGYDRGTGHFGTGTYFVGEKEMAEGNSYYGKRPQHAVDFSDYDMYRVRNDRDGYALHDALKVIDGGLSEYRDNGLSMTSKMREKTLTLRS